MFFILAEPEKHKRVGRTLATTAGLISFGAVISRLSHLCSAKTHWSEDIIARSNRNVTYSMRLNFNSEFREMFQCCDTIRYNLPWPWANLSWTHLNTTAADQTEGKTATVVPNGNWWGTDGFLIVHHYPRVSEVGRSGVGVEDLNLTLKSRLSIERRQVFVYQNERLGFLKPPLANKQIQVLCVLW